MLSACSCPCLYFQLILANTPAPPIFFVICTDPHEQALVQFWAGPRAGRPVSTSAPRRRRVIPPLLPWALRARSALAAPRPGLRGPGPVSSGRADVAGSGRTGPGLALRVGNRTVPDSACRATSPTHWAERATPRAAALSPVRSRGDLRWQHGSGWSPHM
jgi:hypothetical protein